MLSLTFTIIITLLCSNYQPSLTVPTLLLAPTKYVLAMAALRASIGHMGSLRVKAETLKGLNYRAQSSLPECSNSGRRVKHYFRSVKSIGAPVEGMMTTITDIDSNAP